MIKAAFVVMLIGIGMIFLASAIHGDGDVEKVQRAFLILPGFFLMFGGGVLWFRLVVLGWIVRFVSFNWASGKDQYRLRQRRGADRSLCNNKKDSS
jgi:hypothetical protein